MVTSSHDRDSSVFPSESQSLSEGRAGSPEEVFPFRRVDVVSACLFAVGCFRIAGTEFRPFPVASRLGADVEARRPLLPAL
jgi:hypothetical protein